jgi:hypothetical protein
MKTVKKLPIILITALLGLVITATPALAAYMSSGFNIWPLKTADDVNKPWQVRFSMPVDPATVSNSTIYVTDSDNRKEDSTLTISDDKKAITVGRPSGQTYSQGNEYRLYITSGVKSVGGESSLSAQVALPFVIADANSKILAISSGSPAFLTNITVITSQDIHSVKANGEEMIYKGNSTYTMGLTGLESGDSITIKAYNENGSLKETKKHTI